MIEFVIGGRPPNTRGRWEMRKPWSTTKGGRRREAGERGGLTVTGPGSRVAGPGSPHSGESRGVSTEAQELDHQRGGSDVSEVLRAPGEIGLGGSPLLAAAWQPSGVGLLRGVPAKLWAWSLVDW